MCKCIILRKSLSKQGFTSKAIDFSKTSLIMNVDNNIMLLTSVANPMGEVRRVVVCCNCATVTETFQQLHFINKFYNLIIPLVCHRTANTYNYISKHNNRTRSHNYCKYQLHRFKKYYMQTTTFFEYDDGIVFKTVHTMIILYYIIDEKPWKDRLLLRCRYNKMSV